MVTYLFCALEVLGRSEFSLQLSLLHQLLLLYFPKVLQFRWALRRHPLPHSLYLWVSVKLLQRGCGYNNLDRIVTYLFCALEVLGRSEFVLWFFAAFSPPPAPPSVLSQGSSVSLSSSSFTPVLPSSSPVLSLNPVLLFSLSSPSPTLCCSMKLKINQLERRGKNEKFII